MTTATFTVTSTFDDETWARTFTDVAAAKAAVLASIQDTIDEYGDDLEADVEWTQEGTKHVGYSEDLDSLYTIEQQ